MEHLQHFGLTQEPFSNEPDLRFYFESAIHLDAQRRVERGLRQHKGLTILTGEGGMGKTLLARRVLDALEEEVFEATLLVMLPGAADATGILQRFARQLGCEEPASDRASLLGQIYEQLAIVREDGRHAVLMVDDAQIMTPEVFAELGGLLNLEYEDRRLVSMLFVGSPELDRLVQNDASIMPRVDVRVQLQPLGMTEAATYLNHRLTAVRGNPELIPAAAFDSLYKFGRGRPRLLNTLADNALFEAYLAGRPAIEPSDVERAAADLGIGPDPGSTFSELNTAVVPPPVAVVEPVPDITEAAMAAPVALAPASESMLDFDEPAADFTLTPEMEAPLGTPSTVDLDEGLEAALEDFGSPELEPAVAIGGDPIAALDIESLDFEAGSLSMVETSPVDAAETVVPILQAEPMVAGVFASDDEMPNFELAEVELSPLGVGEADIFEEAFVELIEE